MPSIAPSSLRHRRTPLLLLPALLVSACGPGSEAPADDAPGEEAAQAPAETAATAPRSADTRLFVIEGLSGPEAVKYEPGADVYLVSNFGENEEVEANDGFITRVAAADGAVLERRWAVGTEGSPLQEPRGMGISADSLWVADARGLHAFHLETGEQLAFVDLTALEPGFLNDVAVGPDGTVYVTDTGTSRLIRLVEGGGEVLAEGEALGSPNGVTVDPSTGHLILVPWRGGGDSLRAWDPDSGDLSIVARSPGGRFDGVEFLGSVMVVASQQDSALHRVEAGQGRPFQTVPGRPADIAVDTRRSRVAVPYIDLDRVDVFPGPDAGGG